MTTNYTCTQTIDKYQFLTTKTCKTPCDDIMIVSLPEAMKFYQFYFGGHIDRHLEYFKFSQIPSFRFRSRTS